MKRKNNILGDTSVANNINIDHLMKTILYSCFFNSYYITIILFDKKHALHWTHNAISIHMFIVWYEIKVSHKVNQPYVHYNIYI